MAKPKILLSPKPGAEMDYIAAVELVGGIATAKYCPEFSDEYDGLVLCGGNDINPALYGEDIAGSVDIDYKRDEAEIKLAKAFIDAEKPVLGICRGYQLLNVLFGGSLIQHLENTDSHRSETKPDRVHNITLKEDSILKKLYRNDEILVNSVHHQAVARLGENLKVTAMCDNVIEAFQHEFLPVLGVQFHPERICGAKDTVDGSEIFKYFIELCK